METILAVLAIGNLITLVLVFRLFRWAGRATTHITHLNGSAAKSAEKLNTISEFLVKQFKVLIARPDPTEPAECHAQPCQAQACQFVPTVCRFEPVEPAPAPDLGPIQRMVQDVKQLFSRPAEKAEPPPPQPKPRAVTPPRARHPIIDERMRFHVRRREKRAAKRAAQAEEAAKAVSAAEETS